MGDHIFLFQESIFSEEAVSFIGSHYATQKLTASTLTDKNTAVTVKKFGSMDQGMKLEVTENSNSYLHLRTCGIDGADIPCHP